MRATDRTLLSSLGFSDPDKVNERHDLACQYVLHPETAKKLAGTVMLAAAKHYNAQSRIKAPEVAIAITELGGKSEVPLSKGEGQYKTTIGFIDACLYGCIETQPAHLISYRFRLNVEVKIGVVPVSSIIRQIKLYSEYLEYPVFALLTDFPISDSEKSLLIHERIHPFRLGPEFDAFCESQRGEKRAVIEEI
jgi:hypothetical protein